MKVLNLIWNCFFRKPNTSGNSGYDHREKLYHIERRNYALWPLDEDSVMVSYIIGGKREQTPAFQASVMGYARNLENGIMCGFKMTPEVEGTLAGCIHKCLDYAFIEDVGDEQRAPVLANALSAMMIVDYKKDFFTELVQRYANDMDGLYDGLFAETKKYLEENKLFSPYEKFVTAPVKKAII